MSDREITAPMKIADKADVFHLVRRGIVSVLHWDVETTSLITDFSQITAYGDAGGDIAGNLIDSEEYLVRRPERHLPNPKALLVTRTSVNELDDPSRMNHREAMARIARRFEKSPMLAAKLPLDEEEISFRSVRRKGGDLYYKRHHEKILHYPLKGAGGEILKDVRIHPDRNMIAYRVDDDPASPYYENIENNYYIDDRDGGKWRLVKPRLLVSGYRIKWYDIAVLRTNMVRAGYHPANIFFTQSRAILSSKQLPKPLAVDGYSVVLNTNLFGPGGEEGLKIDRRPDSRTGESVPSAKLELVMTANTRYENKIRGVREGVRMAHDDSIYDKRKGHKSPAYDALASFSIYNYARKLAPGVVKRMEQQSDEDELRQTLNGLDLRDPKPPVFALMRNTFPNAPTVDPVVFAGFDDQQGQMRRAIMLRLDLNLRTMTYKGKSLLEMAREDLKNPDAPGGNFVRMMREQKRNPEALIRPESIRRWAGAMPLDEALSTEAAKNWDVEKLEQIDDSFRFLMQNDEILEAVRNAVEMINWEMHRRPEPPNPMMEEQWTRNGFGDLDVLEEDVAREKYGLKSPPRKGAVPSILEAIYNKAMDVFKYHNAMDDFLHRLAIQPHPVDYSDDCDDLSDFNELVRRVRQRMAEKGSSSLSVFDSCLDDRGRLSTMTLDEARAFRGDLLLRLLKDDEAQRRLKTSGYRSGLFNAVDAESDRILLANLSRKFRIVDERGRVLPVGFIKSAFAGHPNLVHKKLESREWRVQFFRLSSEPSITAALDQFTIMEQQDRLPPLWRARAEALKRLSLNGPPNEDPAAMRWETIPKLERELKALEINARADSPKALARVFSDYASGDAEFLKADEGQRWLDEYRAFLDRIKAENPMTPAHSAMVQYDHGSGLAYDYIEHEIPAGDCIVIDVPDPHLRNPLRDIRQSPYSLVVPKLSDAARRRARQGAAIVLRGEQTGRLYYGGRASVRQAPEENETTRDYYAQARADYTENAGSLFPVPDNRDVLIVQQLMPIADPGRKVDATVQSLKVPPAYFDGLTAPRLAHFTTGQPLTGLVMPADYCPQSLEAGKPIRFREMGGTMLAKIEGADETETGHMYETELESVRRITLGTLYKDVRAKSFTDDMARRYGYAGAHDMWEKINQAMLDREVPSPDDEELLLLEFAPVKKESWAYFNPPKAPQAAFIHDGRPVPPSAYRWTAPANQNGPVSPDRKTGPA